MSRVLVLLADGFEEIEAVTIIDVLRRAEVSVTAAALSDERVVGSHGIAVLADTRLDLLMGGTRIVDAFEAIILPGGMPGSKHLRDDTRVRGLIAEMEQGGRMVAAICAAPIALEAAGVLEGRRATAYPGHALPSARYDESRVVIDGQLVTSRGPGTALEFALALVEKLVSPARARQLEAAMIVHSPGK